MIYEGVVSESSICSVNSRIDVFRLRDEKVNKTPGGETAEKADSNILALVRDEEITREDLEAAMGRIPERSRDRLSKKVLDNLIEARVFAKEARKARLHENPDVKQAVEKMTNETLARHFVKKYIDEEAEPSEEELRGYYDGHKDEFVVPECVKLQEILAKKEKKVQDALKALKAGTPFAEAAKKHSIARSWEKGGIAGWCYKGKMAPALEKVVFDLEKGKVSDIIKTDKGYMIVNVLDKRDERLMAFEETKLKIRIMFFGKRKNGKENNHKAI